MITRTLIALALSLLTFGQTSHAAQDWAAQLDQYKTEISALPTKNLVVYYAGNTALTAAACGASTALAVASFITETAPVLNGGAELLAKTVDPEYKTMTTKSLLEWESLMQYSLGAAGGGLVAVKDTLKFVLLMLSGKEAEAFAGVKKIYASSMATANALFSQQGLCMMSASKAMLISQELQKRRAK